MIICGDSAIELTKFSDNYFDMVLTSPPYDNLRSYKGYTFNLEVIAQELFRVLKANGTMIWVVGDATIKGSETGTSFKQALHFKEIGFNLYDTMIYKKANPLPQNHNRYVQCFEYMFVLTKDKPKTFNGIHIPCKYAGQANFGNSNTYIKDGNKHSKNNTLIHDTKLHENIFSYLVGSTSKGSVKGHPAVFPLQLALDQVSTWSNENDLVLDPFCGSGTTGVACKNLNRNFVGIEISSDYVNLASDRIAKEG